MSASASSSPSSSASPSASPSDESGEVVTVPLSKDRTYIDDGWMANVQAHLDSNDDVVFRDLDGNNVDVEQFHIAVDGNVKSRSKLQADSDALALNFITGGWHSQKIHKIFADGTDSSLALTVRLKPRI
jgi:ABC-type Fe3+-hydroxamate transport system substrate-binding protein